MSGILVVNRSILGVKVRLGIVSLCLQELGEWRVERVEGFVVECRLRSEVGDTGWRCESGIGLAGTFGTAESVTCLLMISSAEMCKNLV